MRVCFVSHSSSAQGGGAELSLVDLLDALRRRNVHVSCLLPRHGTLEDVLASRGIQTTVVAYKHWTGHDPSLRKRARRLLRNSLALWPLARAIRRSGCDVVYTNTVATPAGALAAKIARKPHVWHVREFGDVDHSLSFDYGIRLTRYMIGWLSAACIANSHAVAQAYAPFLGELVPDVVYNAVEMKSVGDAEQPEAPWRHQGAIRCLMLGRIHPLKGQQDAIRAMVALRNARVPAELILMGEANRGDGERFQRMIAQLRLQDRIRILPFAVNPAPILSTADVVLVCSRMEAFGRVAVEAMKLGKPVIGTRRGGTPELVQHRVTGFLYEPGNSLELAARIGDLHESPAMRASMGAMGRHQAEGRFTSDRYAADVERVLERVVDQASAM